MKKIKNKLAFILAIFVFSSTVSFLNCLEVTAESLRYGETVISKLSNSANIKFVYDKLVDGCRNADATISLQHSTNKITPDELNMAYDIFLNDYPEYFWVVAGHPAYSCNGDYVYNVMPQYNITGALSDAKTRFKNAVNELTQGLSGKSDYEKSLILHDRLSKKVSYMPTSNDQNAYGAIVDGKAVCAGYARAYEHLLHTVGIAGWYITGESLNPATGKPIGHAWNLVQLDGKWYYTDVTWDDQDSTLFYSYLNCTKSQIEKDHTFDDTFKNYLPTANSTDANYFAKNNLIYSSLDISKIGNNLKANNLTSRIYVNGNVTDFALSLNQNLLSIAQAAGLQYGWSCSSLIQILGNEIIYTLNFIDPNHIHSPSLVKGSSATCTSKGMKDYYECSCGTIFSDSTGQNVTDLLSLETPAAEHKPSSWKMSGSEHHKECTVCGAVIVGSADTHQDSNKDYKCDICGYDLPKPQTAPPVQSSQNSAIDSNNNPDIPATQNGVSTENKTPDTESNDFTNSNDNISEISDTTDENEEANINNNDNHKESNNKLIIPIAIVSGVILLGGGTTATIFLIKRK